MQKALHKQLQTIQIKKWNLIILFFAYHKAD